MSISLPRLLTFVGISAFAAPLAAQQFPTDNPILKEIWEEGMDRSQAYQLAQVLLDSIGPRLTGSPGQEAAADWVVKMYESWGIEGRNEAYGTWKGWRRGVTHIDLIEPRVRSLEGTILAWSPGTDGPVTADAIILPEMQSPQDFENFLQGVNGKLVLASFPQPTCRPNGNWEEFGTQASIQRMQRDRQTDQQAWNARLQAAGLNGRELQRRIEQAGAVGIITSRWSNGWGVQKVFDTSNQTAPVFDLSCEDYGLIYRLAENDQNPVLRVNAEAEFLGEVPVTNTIGVIPGTELPNEYVVLSAHFDSWDAGSGATDNGTGTITMMEAMRILKAVYPSPRRTIVVGHWNGEEQGLNGSRAFANDHPEIVDGLQALFNQDNGTGRVVNISMQGLSQVGGFFGRWMSQIPSEISQHIDLNIPGMPSGGGSDQASFICAGAPAFSLGALSWDYGTYTWHTNRDTFDKIVMDDLQNNATLTAMLAYLASEESDRLPRERRVMPTNPQTGQMRSWPTCRDGTRVTNR